jgi:hypothetical protein
MECTIMPTGDIRTLIGWRQKDNMAALPVPNAFSKSIMPAAEKKRPLEGGHNKKTLKISFAPACRADSPLPGNLLADSRLFDSGITQVFREHAGTGSQY